MIHYMHTYTSHSSIKITLNVNSNLSIMAFPMYSGELKMTDFYWKKKTIKQQHHEGLLIFLPLFLNSLCVYRI